MSYYYGKSNAADNFNLKDPINMKIFGHIKTHTDNSNSEVTCYESYTRHETTSSNVRTSGEFNQWSSRETIAPGGAKL